MLSLVPKKMSWVGLFVVQGFTLCMNAFIAIISLSATMRCISVNKAGCVQYFPGSVATVSLHVLILLLDILQMWDGYRIIRGPSFSASPSKRIRILYAWALPFAWLANITLVLRQSWSILATLHILLDPVMIIMAESDEPNMLAVFSIALVIGDILTLVFIQDPFVTTIAWIQMTLSLFGFIMAILSKTTPTQDNIPVAKPVVESVSKTESVPKTESVRLRKSNNIKF